VKWYACAFAYSSFLRGDAPEVLFPNGGLVAGHRLDLIDREVASVMTDLIVRRIPVPLGTL
jgi:hypothetical protein